MNPTCLRKFATAFSQTPDTTLSGRDRRAHPIRLTPDVELSIGLRHTRRRHGKLREPIKPTQRSPLKPTLRLERHRLASDTNGVRLRGEGSDHRTRTLTSD
jgi:hypothetical protein